MTRKSESVRFAEACLSQLGVTAVMVTSRGRGDAVVTATNIIQAFPRGSSVSFYYPSWKAVRKVLQELRSAFGSRFEVLGPDHCRFLEADAGTAIRTINERIGARYAEQGALDDLVLMIAGRIDAAVERMKTAGTLRDLNQTYKTNRSRRDGERLPPYRDWIVQQIGSRLQFCTDPVLLKSLGF